MLEECFAFVDDANDLCSRARLLEQHIIKLLQTTSDCCTCLQEYLRDGFVGMSTSPYVDLPLNTNAGRMLTLGAGEKVDGFIQSLREQKNDLSLSINLHAALVSDRMSGEINLLCE